MRGDVRNDGLVGSSRPDDGLNAVGALHEPVRRALYYYVASRRGEVSRNEAAEAVGIQRSLAAFHLDKLVDAGLLVASFRRLTERSGPGAGRPAKVYRRSEADHQVSLPPRSYDTAAELLAEVVEDAGADAALHAAARRSGRARGASLRRNAIAAATGEPVAARPGEAPGAGERVRPGGGEGAGERGQPGSGEGVDEPVVDLVTLLARHGFEPYRDGDVVRLHNCPFHQLARQFPPLICGMNLAMLEGLVEGAGLDGVTVHMDPAPGRCCVALSDTTLRSKTSGY